jgi:dTMP kinase
VFITLEGGEGAGKSTLQKHLAARLQAEGRQVLTTREPGGSDLGQQVREWVLDHNAISSRAELLLFLADRAQHVEQVILPALKEEKVVLCDRYSDSSIAYQGYGRDIGGELVQQLCDFATAGLQPSLTLLLDIPPEQGLARAPGRDRMESEELLFHEKVREGFHALAGQQPDRFVTIDATASLEEVEAAAWKALEARLVQQ